MTENHTNNIRNIAFVGPAGTGKTSLVESLLAKAGAIKAAGSVDRGSTVSDYDPQEKELQHSLDTAVCHFEYKGTRINVIDTPGYPDFIARSISVLPAVETAALVLSAQTGIETGIRRLMKAARNSRLCRMIVINKIDVEPAKLGSLLADIQEVFGRRCLPLNLPADGGSKILDCFFAPEGGDTDFSSVQEAHEKIIDQVVEVDEALMEAYLESGQELKPGQLHDAFEKALREGHLMPVCFVSAQTGAGLGSMLDTFVKLMPNPAEGNQPPFFKGEGEDATPVEVKPDPKAHVVAHVFKVMVDPYVGRMGIFRVHQGTVRTGGQLYIGDARKPFKVAHLYELQGKDLVEIPSAGPGAICAVTKIDELAYDDVLHDSHDEDNYHHRPAGFPPPMMGLAIEPARRGDEQKLGDAISKIAAEDPGLRIEHRTNTNETVLMGMGDLHLRMTLKRMKERYNVEVDTHPPSISYSETITTAAEGHHRHKKQTGGAGQFGEVFLRVEKLQRGKGFEFVNKVVGGAIPGQFIPAVEKGVRQAMVQGAVAGFPLEDIRVTVHDGKHHPVDSKEVAFVAAGKKAFLSAVKNARPIVLEPIVEIDVTIPADAVGNVTGDLSSRRGRILGNTTLGADRVVIHGEAPLAELQEYQNQLKSMTGGAGMFSMSLSRYEAVPPRVQQDLAAQYKAGDDD
ncbi:MAG: elongation factor G [Gammaproteobacteria bacterium]